MNARAMYPHFIPIHENLLLQVSWALRGLYDSFRVDTLFSAIVRCVVIDVVERQTHWLSVSDAEIRANLFKSVFLNSLSMTSIYIYDIFLHPLVNDQEKWLHRNVGRFYQAFWLLPVVTISFYLNVCPVSVLIPGNYVCWTRVYFNPLLGVLVQCHSPKNIYFTLWDSCRRATPTNLFQSFEPSRNICL